MSDSIGSSGSAGAAAAEAAEPEAKRSKPNNDGQTDETMTKVLVAAGNPTAATATGTAAAPSLSLSEALFDPPSSSGGGGIGGTTTGSSGLFGRTFPAAKPTLPASVDDNGDDDDKDSSSESGGSNADRSNNSNNSSEDEVQYVQPSSSSSSPPRPKAHPSPKKPAPGGGGRKLSPRKMSTPAANTNANAAANPSSPFDAKTSAIFAKQAQKLRKRNLTAEVGQQVDVGIIGGGSGGVGGGGSTRNSGGGGGYRRVHESPPNITGAGGGGGGGGAEDYMYGDYYGMCDDDDDEDEEYGEYYNQQAQMEEEEEGPDGLTATERMYIHKEYEQMSLSEREWQIRQRQRRRIVCDKQAKMTSICSLTVGEGGLMTVEQFRNSSASALAASTSSATAASATPGSKLAAQPAQDPYDLLNSDEEPEMDRELKLRRDQSLEVCSTLMTTVGVAVIKNKPETAGTAKTTATEVVDSDVEILSSTSPPAVQTERIIPPDLMKGMVAAARKIEKNLCDRLDAKGEKWRADKIEVVDMAAAKSTHSDSGDEKKEDTSVVAAVPEEEMKMPSKETVAMEEEERKKRAAAASKKSSELNFRYQEVASRCPGRIDSRYRMDRAPFNDPRVIANPLLLPVVKSMLGGENGGAQLVYAGLIFSFPGSSDQPWHMDGEALFPDEQWLDLPPYALNVFIPLEDVTDELGPTEFVPGTHTYEKAEEINEELAQWAMIESRWTAAGDDRASMRMVLGSEEAQWMTRNSAIAPLLRQGDALIYDYRVCHRGTKNLSTNKTRTMLYLMYARPWFKEHMNFGKERLFDEERSSSSGGSAGSEISESKKACAEE